MARLPSWYRNSFFSSSSSLESSSPSTATVQASSLYSSSSGSFVAGPGELTGRALRAFGKMTLGGVQSIIVHRRLRTINSYIPHRDDSVIPGLQQVYSDILELSRCVSSVIHGDLLPLMVSHYVASVTTARRSGNAPCGWCCDRWSMDQLLSSRDRCSAGRITRYCCFSPSCCCAWTPPGQGLLF